MPTTDDAGVRRSPLDDLPSGATSEAQVRKGERGTPIIYWKVEEERSVRGEDGKPVYDKDGNSLKETVQLERPRSFISYVFNAEQIDGLPPLVADKERVWADVQRAENILERPV